MFCLDKVYSCGLTRKASKTPWKKTRISPYWKGKLVEYFCLGVPAQRLHFQVPYSQPTLLRWFRMLRETIYRNTIRSSNLFPERLRWMKLYLVVEDLANVVGEPQGKAFFWDLLEKRTSLDFSPFLEDQRNHETLYHQIYQVRQSILHGRLVCLHLSSYSW